MSNPQGLQPTPRLLARALLWRNRWNRVSRSARLLSAIALPVLAVGAVVAVHEGLGLGDGQLAALDRHRVLIAVIAGFGAATLVARRRAFERSEAKRSWLAALPVRAASARWESVVIASVPACMMLIGLPLIALTTPRLAMALLGGILVGAVAGYLIPEARVEDLPPGSRYVPYRRVAPRIPKPSLSALGLWPVRRLFASLRPQVVTRAAIPLMLAIPLGATADIALVLIGIVASVAATALLVAAMLAVSKAATRWLLPLPVRRGTIAAQVLVRPMVVVVLLAVLAAWLLWVYGVTPREAAERGVLLFLLAAAGALGGSVLLIQRASRGGS